jgi:hypothetical protein
LVLEATTSNRRDMQVDDATPSVGRESSVRSLQALYAAVVAFALGVAVEQLVLDEPGGVSVAWERLPLLIAFLVTIIPFFHGAMCHLERSYLQKADTQLRSGALLSDFVILFVQAVIFFIFARSMPDARLSTAVLLTLLALDVVWGVTTSTLLRRRPHLRLAPMRWAIVNLCTLPFLAVILLLDTDVPEARTVDGRVALGLMVVAAVRTVADYAVSWHDLYFPWRSGGEGPTDQGVGRAS